MAEHDTGDEIHPETHGSQDLYTPIDTFVESNQGIQEYLDRLGIAGLTGGESDEYVSQRIVRERETGKR